MIIGSVLLLIHIKNYSSNPDDTGIIYCRKRSDCDKLAKSLCDAGISALPYYSNLSDKQKSYAHSEWQNNKVSVIVATVSHTSQVIMAIMKQLH